MAAFDEVDLEMIGALIDGRLTGAERERAIKLLGESEAAFEVYTDALRVRADLDEDEDEEEQDNTVVPIDKRRSRKTFAWPAIGSAAAAAILMIALLPSLRVRRDQKDLDVLNAPASQITLALVRRPDLGRTLEPQWDQRTWSVTRGGGSQLVDTTIAFRLGVRAVDVSVAIAAGDSERASRLTAEIMEALDRIPLSDEAKAEYSGLRAQLAGSAPNAQLRDAAARAEAGLGEAVQPFWFAFGRWVGGGELAASTRTEDFFEESLTKRFLTVARERSGMSPTDMDLLGEIAVLAGNGVTGDEFGTLRQHFQTLIRRHGG